jgi:hypothetical protein
VSLIAMQRAALVLTAALSTACASSGLAPAERVASSTNARIGSAAERFVEAPSAEPNAAPRSRLSPPFRRAAGVRHISAAGEGAKVAEPAVVAAAELRD